MDTTGKPVEDDIHVPNAGKKDPDQVEGDCWKQIRCANCRQVKEIIEVKYKRNVSFLEARKIVETYMGENRYASVARRADTTNEDNKYRTLVEKLIKLETNDWPKFLEQLRKLLSAEFYQTSAQQPVGNGERSNVVIRTKTHVGSTTPTRTTSKGAKSEAKQLLHMSPIRSKTITDRLKKLVSHKT